PDPHVSLLETYAWQMSRGGAGSIFSATGQFREFFDQWWQTDPTLVLGGLGAAVLTVLLFRFIPVAGAVALLALTYLAFLARGGVVLYYYIIPVLALLALVAGLLQGYVARLLGKLWAPLGRLAAVLILVLAGVRTDAAAQASSVDFTERPTEAQDAAAQWMIHNLPHDSIILMDSYAWVELRDPATTGGQPFSAAHYYWPGVSDPSLSEGVLHNDWRTIDYLAMSPSVEADIANRQLPILPDALDNSDEIQTFYSDNWSVRILRVRKLHEQVASTDPFLMNTWTTFKTQYVHDGEVVSPGGRTATSESQANSLLRAVYADDRPAFDQIWSWTQTNLQVRQSDSLLAHQWGPQPDGSLGVMDAQSAAGADEDTALALLFAARRWNDSTYQANALAIINDLWTSETAVVGGQRVLLGAPWSPGSDSSEQSNPVVNTSYLAPYAYRIFQQVDPDHSWLDLVDSSYDILGRIRASSQFGGSAGVVPNWIALDPNTGELKPADALGPGWSLFDYESSQVPWRLGLDWLWFKDNRATDALAGITLPYRQLSSDNFLLAAYMADGQPAADYEATSMYAATLPGVLISQDRNLAETVFADKVLRDYHVDGGTAYFGNPDDLNDQTWSWFATALMDGGMANLWSGDSALQWDEVLP
ncbi:MAG: hypothetical protein JOY61_07665, partial [Chloroflexi bacterium]|nr:hypothetical protein [Chloroflexota bacterium]